MSGDTDERLASNSVEEWGFDIQPLCDVDRSKHVEALNLLNEDYVEEHFTRQLTRECYEEGITESLENVVVGSQVDSIEKSIVFELTSPAIAEWLVKKGSTSYDGREVLFLEYESALNTRNNKSARMPTSRAETASGKMPSCSSLPLNCPEDTTLFLRALLKFRRTFHSTDHSDGEACVQRELDKQGIEATMSEIKKKRRCLLDNYRRQKKRGNFLWDYFIPCGVLVKDFPKEKLRETEFDFWEENKRRASLNKTLDYENVTFRKVAVWPLQCTEELIALYKQFQLEFDKPENHSPTWHKIGESLYIKDRRMIYSATQCENKWDALTSTDRTLREKVDNTGAEGALRITSSWPHYQDMDELLHDDVTVQPPKTVALGSTHVTRTSSPEETGRVGKTLPSTLTRGSPNDSALLKIAKAMEERNKLMAERIAVMAGKKSAAQTLACHTVKSYISDLTDGVMVEFNAMISDFLGRLRRILYQRV